MGLIAKDKGGGDFTPIPEDLYLAICYGIWDLGTQFSEKWDKSIHKILIVWELPEVRSEFEKTGKNVSLPRAISKRYTLSLHKKADLRRDLESWRGKKFTEEELKGFDLKKLLGVPCQLQIIHNKMDDKLYANIAAIIKAPAGSKIKPENPVKFFSFEEKMQVPDETPEWISDIIKQSEEYRKAEDHDETNPGHGDEIDADGVPF